MCCKNSQNKLNNKNNRNTYIQKENNKIKKRKISTEVIVM